MKKSLIFGLLMLSACAEMDTIGKGVDQPVVVPTPTVDYVSNIDPYAGEHKDMFLSQLTMNYRSYAVYNARVSGYPDIGELFAQKAVSAFSGQRPMPESLDNWNVTDTNKKFDLQNAAGRLNDVLNGDVPVERPQLAAEAQAKFDCWLSSTASGQDTTADECHKRFDTTMTAIDGNGGIVSGDKVADAKTPQAATSGFESDSNTPNTAELGFLTDTKRTRDGVVIVNNINVPNDLIRPAPVHPVVINQNIYGNTLGGQGDGTVGAEMVSRDEFINMMMALRSEIQAINSKLDSQPVEDDLATIKVQQMPTPNEPKQKMVEEIFEVHFDFNKAAIKPEYETVVQKLAATARDNRNVKISVVGHTDTVGTDNYNYALGGRRAESVKQMLVSYGVPASSIIVVSSGKNDLKVATPNNVKNPDNRRVRVVKEQGFIETQSSQDNAPNDVQDNVDSGSGEEEAFGNN